MTELNSVCVYCGASEGGSAVYAAATRELGQVLAERGVTVVYGGGSVGLMGVLADAALQAGGRVVGVIPDGLFASEIAHPGVTKMHIVRSMHERKALMADLSDAFISLPGGLGTMDETFEMLTWAQLGLHDKPCGMLNVAGYYDRIQEFLDHAVAERFLRPVHRRLLIVDTDPVRLLHQFELHRATAIANPSGTPAR